jgi:uncharacterized NAD-dependent epimerase/dehydratase family protein
MTERLAIYAEGLWALSDAKTGHGVLRYSPREVVAVVDSTEAGRRAGDVVPYTASDAPIVASVTAAAEAGATNLLIGVAPPGGVLTDAWRAALVEAMECGMTVEAGLHTVLGQDEHLVAVARANGVELRDLRWTPATPRVPRIDRRRPAGLGVVHAVGTDSAIGKMTVTLELDRAARGRGLASAFVATGQTGIAISGWGYAVDHVISDYVAGTAEMLIDEGVERGADLLFVEGQGALHHPAYSAVTLGLLHGCRPDAMVLVHQAGTTVNSEYADVAIRPLGDVARAYEQILAPIHDGAVVAVALNTRGLTDEEAAAAVADAHQATGLPAADVVRHGADTILGAVLAHLGR